MLKFTSNSEQGKGYLPKFTASGSGLFSKNPFI
jgi:hypothetical protein